jgi:hypothetical protein
MKFLRGLLILLVFAGLAAPAAAQWTLDIESGPVWSGYNDIRIPGDTGTKFSVSRDLDAKSAVFFRALLSWQVGKRHTLSLLYAPLTLKASGSVSKPLVFYEETFGAGVPLEARYTFNSYRLTYRYTLRESSRWRAGIGFTAKIRDAVIGVEGGGKSSRKTNVGFVPLINFKVEWLFSPRWSLLFEGDALAAPQGRAEDVLLAFRFDATKSLQFKAGYRIVEGGADNDEVYTFALINYVVVGAVLRF